MNQPKRLIVTREVEGKLGEIGVTQANEYFKRRKWSVVPRWYYERSNMSFQTRMFISIPIDHICGLIAYDFVS